MDLENEITETEDEEEVPSYVEQQAADFVLFCDVLEISAQPDDDTSYR